MRLEQLGLVAFGHFRDHHLDLSHAGSGLQVIYGANEAGKSTALRAIRALLYGVPQQSQDTFLFEGKDVRISGTLLSDGERLEMVRRKGRKNTLLSPLGDALPESVLRPFLGGVDEALFNSMFGLDHESLRQGAHALLALEGKVGETLFGAGLGSNSVRRMLARFRAHADEIFTSKGRSKRINQEIAQLRQARELVQENSTSAAGYVRAEAELQALQEQLSALRERRRSLTQRKGELERRLRVLPLVAQRRSYLQQFDALGELPVLPADAEQQRQQAVKLSQEARTIQQHVARDVARVQQRLDALQVDQKLLGIAPEQMEELANRLGGYRKARVDLPKRETELRVLHAEVDRQLRRLGRAPSLEHLDEMRLSRDEESRIRRLAREKTQYDTKLAANAVKLKRAETAVLRLKGELGKQAPQTDTRALERALVRAQKYSELELQLDQAKARLTGSNERLQSLNQSLQPFKRPASDEAVAGHEPSTRDEWWGAGRPVAPETIAEFESNLDALEQQLIPLSTEIERLQERQVGLEQELRDMNEREDIPSEDQLRQLRDSRDLTLNQLLHKFQQPASSDRGGAPSVLVQLLVEQVARSDAYADRIRAMADRVAARRAKEAALRELTAQLELRQSRASALRAERAERDEQWRGLWQHSAFLVASPRQMRVVLERCNELASAERERESTLAQVRRLEDALSRVVAELSEELGRVGEPGRLLWESLGQFVQRLESVLEQHRAQNLNRRDLVQRLELEQEQLSVHQQEQRELKEAGRVLRGEWQRVVKRLELSKEAGPEDVSAALDALSEVFRNVDEAQGLQRRIAGMERDNQVLREEVTKLYASVGAPVDETAAIEALPGMLTGYRNARAAEEERQRLTEELSQRAAVLDKAETELGRAQAMLQSLFEAAGVDDVDALNRVLQRVSRAAELRAAIDNEERRLLAQGEGASVHELVAQCQGLASSEVQAEIAAMQEESASLERAWEGMTTERAAREQALARLSKGAANAAEDLEGRVAQLKGSVRRYLRFRLAASLLESEIERYREAHQGPVIERANALFPRLTLGRYSSLRVGFDAKDEPILQCCTRDERRVSVDGLSDGTRDQLYLSLRLASLEHYMQANTVMPLVLDDILIHFDDERARAALEVLDQFSQQTQVLFFTHHSRLVELAREVVAPAQLSVHTLPGAA